MYFRPVGAVKPDRFGLCHIQSSHQRIICMRELGQSLSIDICAINFSRLGHTLTSKDNRLSIAGNNLTIVKASLDNFLRFSSGYRHDIDWRFALIFSVEEDSLAV